MAERRVLKKDVEQLWILSGEKRPNQGVRAIPPANIPDIYKDWKGDDRILAESLLMIGAKLPELLAFVDRKVRPMKRPSLSPHDQAFEDVLPKIHWMQGKKVFTAHPEQYQVYKPQLMTILLIVPGHKS